MEKAITFALHDKHLLGIVSQPETPADVGVVLVVGGGQYRVGSHRQFVQLCRGLARAGIASLRFDYRGMGDSEGSKQPFDDIDEDIRAACDAFQAETGLKRVVLWGLCDAASAAMMYAADDPRVEGLVLLNPWLRSEEAMGRVMVRHYYLQRLLSRDFWHKLLRGRVKVAAGLADAKGFVKDSMQQSPAEKGAYPVRMREAMARFRGHISLVLSAEDLTAREFEQQALRGGGWPVFAGDECVVTRVDGADHTFSSSSAKREVENITIDLVRRAAASTA